MGIGLVSAKVAVDMINKRIIMHAENKRLMTNLLDDGRMPSLGSTATDEPSKLITEQRKAGHTSE